MACIFLTDEDKRQIMAEIKKISGGTATDEQIAEAVENYLEEHPVEGGGEDGASAYEIWLAQGNSGTEADFLASLNGGAFIITATASGGELTNVSHTFGDIYTAYTEGQHICLHIHTASGSTVILQCTNIDADNAFFDAVTTVAGENFIHSAKIFSDNTSTYTTNDIAAGEVTSIAIIDALGYTPADEVSVSSMSDRMESFSMEISEKLGADELPDAINTALAQAKASGEFDGADGAAGKDGYTPVKGVDYFDGEDGKDGADGSDGADGVSITSVQQTTTSTADGGKNVITVTLSNGQTSTFEVKNGSKGSTGEAGKDGSAGAAGKDGADGADGNGIKSAVLNANYTLTLTFTDGTSYTTPSIRGATGATGADGAAGKDGEDYVLTDADKTEIAQEAAGLIDIPTTLPASDVYDWAKQPNKPTYTKSEVGLGNVDNVKQYSASNPPPYPVTSVNGQTGDVTVEASGGEVTSESIIAALGYTPADEDDIPTSNVPMGNGYATCSTAAATTIKTVSKSGFKRVEGGRISVRFVNAVPADAKLNINSTGAKPIKRGTSNITAGVINAGDIATFVYNSASQFYFLTSVHRSAEGVTSVNGKTGAVQLNASDVGAASEEAVNHLSATVTNQQTTLSNSVLFTAQTLTEAQKAQARENIGASAGEDIEPADSVEWLNENGDTSKKYVLPDGYIYAWMYKKETVEHNANDGTGLLNLTVGGVRGEYNAQMPGVWSSPFIAIDPTVMAPVDARADTIITISGLDKIVPVYNNSSVWTYYYNQDGSQMFAQKGSAMSGINSDAEITLPLSYQLKNSAHFLDSNWANVYGVRITLGISTDGAITEDDIKNLKVNIPFYNTEIDGYGWYSTGQQHSNDKATQQNSADIAALKEDVATLKEAVQKSPSASGAVWYAIGDSITYGLYSTSATAYSQPVVGKRWVDYVAKYNGYELTNLGKSNAGFLTSPTFRSMVDGANFADADLVTIMLGINDWKYEAAVDKVGTMDDDITTGGTIVSELRYGLEKIIADNPYCKIILITPINAKIGSRGTEETNWAYGFSGTITPCGSLKNFGDKLKEVCEYYGVQVVDMTNSSVVNRKSIVTVLPDGIHPNLDCYKALGLELARRITFA